MFVSFRAVINKGTVQFTPATNGIHYAKLKRAFIS